MESTLIFGERGKDSGVRPSPPSQYLHPVPPSSITESHHPASMSPSHASLQSLQQMGMEKAWTQHPHLGRGPLDLGSGSQQGRHSERSQPCCRSGQARRAVVPGRTHPHPLHTLSRGSQPGKHSGKSQAGSRRLLGHTGLGSGGTRPHLHGQGAQGHTCFRLPPDPHSAPHPLLL